MGPRPARRRRGPRRRRAACSTRRRELCRDVRRDATPARSQSSTPTALRDRDARARGDQRAGRPGRLVRVAAVRHRHRRPGARRAAAARAGARDRDRDQAAVLRARVGRARRRPRRGAARRRRARLLPPPPAQRPALPPAPALRARGEDPGREVDLEPDRVGAGCSASCVAALRVDARRRGADARASRSAGCSRPTASSAATAAEAVSAALEPGLRTRAFIYNTLVHDKSVEDRLRPTRTGWPAATWPTRPPTSR